MVNFGIGLILFLLLESSLLINRFGRGQFNLMYALCGTSVQIVVWNLLRLLICNDCRYINFNENSIG